MTERTRTVGIAVVIACLLGRFVDPWISAAWAAFNPSPVGWDATFEANPANTDSLSEADDHMRQIKVETSNRLETELDFGEFDNVTTDTGRLLEGAARAFVQDAAPTVDGTIGATCLAEADYDGNRGCDEGRLWADSNDGYKLYVAQDSDADGDADAWQPVNAVPQNAIILWDTSDACPTGYSEVTAFRNHTIRGADRASADGNVPDSAGVSCDGSAAPAGCGALGGTEAYDDNLEGNEGEAHAHGLTTAASTANGSDTSLARLGATSTTTLTTSNVDTYPGGRDHLHPLRTVLFCRKD